MVAAEADQLPGLVIDRYDDVVVMQVNTARMDRLTPLIVEAPTDLLPWRNRCTNDMPARRQEGLADEVSLLVGSDANAEVVEDGVKFAVDPLGGGRWPVFRSATKPRSGLDAREGCARARRVLPCWRVRSALRGGRCA